MHIDVSENYYIYQNGKHTIKLFNVKGAILINTVPQSKNLFITFVKISTNSNQIHQNISLYIPLFL